MDELAFLRELRKGIPGMGKAEKGMRNLSRFCLFAALWNFGFYFAAPYITRDSFNLPAEYPYLALITLSLVAMLSLWSAQKIKESEPLGKKIGQIALILLLCIIIGFVYLVAQAMRQKGASTSMILIFGIALAGQSAVLVYLGIRYLSRLTMNGNSYTARYRQPDNKI